MINVGYLITGKPWNVRESRGLHYTIDYPHAQKIGFMAHFSLRYLDLLELSPHGYHFP